MVTADTSEHGLESLICTTLAREACARLRQARFGNRLSVTVASAAVVAAIGTTAGNLAWTSLDSSCSFARSSLRQASRWH